MQVETWPGVTDKGGDESTRQFPTNRDWLLYMKVPADLLE
jgi:hypothetical protein